MRVMILLLLSLMLTTQSIHEKIPTEPKKKIVVVDKYTHIKKYITKVTGNDKYAECLSKKIVYYSKKYKIEPEVTTGVAKVESDFRMNSKPCVGIMQVYLPTYRETDKSTRLNPYKLEDNIHLGVRELARYYNKPSRSRPYQRLRYALGRYNGSGSNSRYTRKVIKTIREIKNGKTKDN